MIARRLDLSYLGSICDIVSGYGWEEESGAMKSFIIACVAAIVIAIIGGLALNSIQKPVDEAFTTSGVRLGV
jgi:hypothetical protein